MTVSHFRLKFFTFSCFIYLFIFCLCCESKSASRSVVSGSLQPHALYSPWNSPGQNTGVDSLSLLKPGEFSQPRDRTQVSLIAGGFFTSWAPREAVVCYSHALSVFWKCSVVTTPLYCLMKKHWPIHSILEERKNIVSYILFNVWKREPEKWKCELLCHVWLSVTPMDYYLPGSSIHEIFQARIQEWVSILFSRESSQFRDHTWVPHNAGRFVTIWATKNYYM